MGKPYKSTATELKDFKEGKIYEDMLHELSEWLNDIHENMEAAESHDAFVRLQGNAEAVRNFHNLIDNMINNAGITEEV